MRQTEKVREAKTESERRGRRKSKKTIIITEKVRVKEREK